MELHTSAGHSFRFISPLLDIFVFLTNLNLNMELSPNQSTVFRLWLVAAETSAIGYSSYIFVP
jgi:hypothetical protein